MNHQNQCLGKCWKLFSATLMQGQIFQLGIVFPDRFGVPAGTVVTKANKKSKL